MIALIYRDFVLPGQEALYRTIEEDAARICLEFECPHPHFAIESLSGAKEVWWLNCFDSEAEKARVVDAYAQNEPLTRELSGITQRKQGVVGPPVEVWAIYQPHLSSEPFNVTGARFFVVQLTKEPVKLMGAVFQDGDGTRYAFRPATDLEEATALAGADSIVFAVRPYWGLPAPEWIAADPEFWSRQPNA